jgi:hypothetical protein
MDKWPQIKDRIDEDHFIIGNLGPSRWMEQVISHERFFFTGEDNDEQWAINEDVLK